MKRLFASTATLLLSLTAFAIGPITGPTTVCSGATITLSNATAGGTWTSSNVAVASVDIATGVVTGTLATTSPGTAIITYTAAATDTTSSITVYPTPQMTSPLNPAAICDSTIFTYIPMSSISGTTFSWMRPYLPGIVTPSASGFGGMSELLDNSVYVPVVVKYLYTLTAYGCSNDDTVEVIVNPTPHLTSATADSVCGGTPYNYIPSSGYSGTTFTWNRAAVPGISNGAAAGTGVINETLNNISGSPVTVAYVITMSIGSCVAYDTVLVKVNPCINGITEVNKAHVEVYPNPNNGVFTVTIPASAMCPTNARVIITDVLGRKVQEIAVVANKEHTIHLDVAPGLYVLTAYTSAGVMVREMVVR